MSRFERAGGHLIFDPQARSVHEHAYTRAALWKRERAMGFNAWQFYDKWSRVEPGLADFMLFWSDPATIPPPSPWRRRLGDGLIRLLDRIAPASRLNRSLYERMVFSHRLEGVAAAWRMAHGQTGGQAEA